MCQGSRRGPAVQAVGPRVKRVLTALTEIARAEVGDVVVPQTVLVEEYWDEIVGALVDQGVEVAAVTLHVDVDEHLRRIETDMLSRPEDDAGRVPAARWRELRRRDYDAALPWLRAKTLVLDTTGSQPDDVARAISSAVSTVRRGEATTHTSVSSVPAAPRAMPVRVPVDSPTTPPSPAPTATAP